MSGNICRYWLMLVVKATVSMKKTMLANWRFFKEIWRIEDARLIMTQIPNTEDATANIMVSLLTSIVLFGEQFFWFEPSLWCDDNPDTKCEIAEHCEPSWFNKAAAITAFFRWGKIIGFNLMIILHVSIVWSPSFVYPLYATPNEIV